MQSTPTTRLRCVAHLCEPSWPLLSSSACHKCCRCGCCKAPALQLASSAAAAAALLRPRLAGCLAGALRPRPLAAGASAAAADAAFGWHKPQTARCWSESAGGAACWPRNSRAAACMCRPALHDSAAPAATASASAACCIAEGWLLSWTAASAACSSAAASRALHQAACCPPSSAAAVTSSRQLATAAWHAFMPLLPPLQPSCARATRTAARQYSCASEAEPDGASSTASCCSPPATACWAAISWPCLQ